MEKKCFIILPGSEPEGYAKGHFGRVYQYILVPACRMAGVTPIQVGEPTMNESPLGIVQTMIESDIVLCDLSSNDPHALYGFAIRHALNLPVVLIKDIKTNATANIPEFEIVEYDESLRIDTVQTEVEVLGEALKKTLATKPVPYELLNRLNISSAQSEVPAPEFVPIPLEEPEKKSHLPFISPLPDYVGEPLTQPQIDKLKVGDSFFHMNYGMGEILTINHKTKDILAKIQFESGSKLLVLVPSDIFRKIEKH